MFVSGREEQSRIPSVCVVIISPKNLLYVVMFMRQLFLHSATRNVLFFCFVWILYNE